MGLRNVASRLIARHGQAASLLRPSGGTTDDFGGYTPGPNTAYPCTVFVATSTVNEEFVAAGLVGVGEQRVLVSVEGLTVEPEVTDKLLIDGTEFEARRVTSLAPSGEVIFWEMLVRRG